MGATTTELAAQNLVGAWLAVDLQGYAKNDGKPAPMADIVERAGKSAVQVECY